MYLPLLAELAKNRDTVQEPEEMHHAVLFGIPALLDDDVLAFLYHQLTTQEDADPGLVPAFQDLIRQRAALDEGEPWLFGFGPMEMGIRRCEKGESTWEEAAARLSQRDFLWRFSPEYAARLGARYLVRASAGEWQQIIEPMRLLLAITRDWGKTTSGLLPSGTEWEDARVSVQLNWMSIIKETCCVVSDGRLHREAIRQGELLLEEAQAAGNLRMMEAAAFGAGLLCLDPYIAGLSSANVISELKRREERFILQNQKALAGRPEEEWRMPPIQEALARGATYLEMALVKPDGSQRGRVLKALAELCLWQQVLGEKSARDVAALCDEALRHLEGAEYADVRRSVMQILKHATHHSPAPRKSPRRSVMQMLGLAPRESAPADKPASGEAGDPHQFGATVAEVGFDRAVHRVLRDLNALLPDKPDEVWALGRRFWPEIDRHCPESERRLFAETMLTCTSAMAKHKGLMPPKDNPPRTGQDFAGYLDDFDRRDKTAGWTQRDRLLAILSLVPPATKLDGEGPLLELLQTVTVDRELHEEFQPLLRFLDGTLQHGAGSNAWKNEQAAEAAVYYCGAIEAFLKDQRPTSAFDCLDYLRDVAHAGLTDYETALALSVYLSEQAAPLANALGAVAEGPLQWIFKRVVGGLIPSGNMEALLIATQAAKAASFACATARPGALGALDEREAEELERIKELRTEYLDSRSGRQLPATTGLDDETLLASYIEPMGKPVDSSLKGKLDFASRRFDQREFARASASGLEEKHAFRNIAEIKQSLGEDTVLLNFFLAVTADEMETWLVMGFTAENVFGGCIQTSSPSLTFEMSDDRSSASLDMTGLTVATLRSAIRGNGPELRSGDPPVTAEEMLENASRQFMGAVTGELAALRSQGKSHLCIVPQGALHYLPFHLLSPRGKPLADDWTVSYLPALQFLKQPDTSREGDIAKERTTKAAVFGLDFENNQHRQNAIPDVKTEVEQIAAVLGIQPVLNEWATEQRVTGALQECRYVHLATHGVQDVLAPAFHTVLLEPDGAEDGRLEAHELARLDMRGLELITLAACDTSLGRIDQADNPRGIPASLFQAGAATLVGTLWPVGSVVARHFFVRFYQALEEGQDKLQAFRIAQQHTRQVCPAYRNWGAFTFTGRWL
jgi:hypothetical protein